MTHRIPRITGTFVDFSQRTHYDSDLLDWGPKEWLSELEDMKEAGIDTVILHRTMRYGLVYYHSKYFETHLERDWLRPFMNAAEEVGMKVYISGLVSDHFFNCDDATFLRLMDRDVYINFTVIRELIELYRGYRSLSGIYIAHEADPGNLRSEIRIDAARSFFGDLYLQLKAISDLPIMSSPFFSRTTRPIELADFWDRFLDRRMFDILAIQDGVGCNRDINPDDIPSYFDALKRVFTDKNIRFWHNAESFSFHPGFRRSSNDRKQIWLHPAPLERLKQQTAAGFTSTEKTITWEYGHFLSRLQVGEDWYGLFKQWNLGVIHDCI